MATPSQLTTFPGISLTKIIAAIWVSPFLPSIQLLVSVKGAVK